MAAADLHPTTSGVEAATVLRPGKGNITDANFPVDPEGRTYHLGTKKGEVGAGCGYGEVECWTQQGALCCTPRDALACLPACLPAAPLTLEASLS